MDKEILKALIEELGTIALEAVAGKKFAVLAIKFAMNVMTRDFVLDKLVNLFGTDPVAFMTKVKSHAAAKVKVAAAPECTIDEACAKFDADLKGNPAPAG